MVHASPHEIQWLTPEDARQIGLDVRLITRPATGGGRSPQPVPDATSTSPPPELGVPAAPTEPAGPIEERAKTFAAEYFNRWSEQNGQALAFFAGAYASEVNFYGQRLARPLLLAEKRDYTARWPVRVYSARPDSLRAFCNPANATCVVTGVVDWDCRNPQRDTQSVGTANFILTVRLVGDGTRILAEAGSVITREVK